MRLRAALLVMSVLVGACGGADTASTSTEPVATTRVATTTTTEAPTGRPDFRVEVFDPSVVAGVDEATGELIVDMPSYRAPILTLRGRDILTWERNEISVRGGQNRQSLERLAGLGERQPVRFTLGDRELWGWLSDPAGALTPRQPQLLVTSRKLPVVFVPSGLSVDGVDLGDLARQTWWAARGKSVDPRDWPCGEALAAPQSEAPGLLVEFFEPGSEGLSYAQWLGEIAVDPGFEAAPFLTIPADLVDWERIGSGDWGSNHIWSVHDPGVLATLEAHAAAQPGRSVEQRYPPMRLTVNGDQVWGWYTPGGVYGGSVTPTAWVDPIDRKFFLFSPRIEVMGVDVGCAAWRGWGEALGQQWSRWGDPAPDIGWVATAAVVPEQAPSLAAEVLADVPFLPLPTLFPDTPVQVGPLIVVEQDLDRVVLVGTDGAKHVLVSAVENPRGTGLSPDGLTLAVAVAGNEPGEGSILLVTAGGDVTTVVDGLDHPEDVAFYDDATLVFTGFGDRTVNVVATDGTGLRSVQVDEQPTGIVFVESHSSSGGWGPLVGRGVIVFTLEGHGFHYDPETDAIAPTGDGDPGFSHPAVGRVGGFCETGRGDASCCYGDVCGGFDVREPRAITTTGPNIMLVTGVDGLYIQGTGPLGPLADPVGIEALDDTATAWLAGWAP